MNFVESFRIALRALNANKVRSALTMLGVIIGVAAVILLVAIGTGVQGEISGTIEGLGSNLIFVFPGNFEEGGGQGPGGGSATKQFTLDDAENLQSKAGLGEPRCAGRIGPRDAQGGQPHDAVHDLGRERVSRQRSSAATM